MKNLLVLLLAIILLSSCDIVETKESKMKKDVEKYIEISCSGNYSEMVRFSFELAAKYTEQDQYYFHNTLMNELRKRQQEGLSSGLLDVYLLLIDSFNDLVNIDTESDNSKPIKGEVKCDDPYCCGE